MPENQSEIIAEPEAPKDAEQPVEDKPKRKGPRPAAEIRAEVEAEKEAEIAALRAQLAAAQEAAAQAEAKADPGPATWADFEEPETETVMADPNTEGATVVHFVNDGLTLDGQVRYRGEEFVLTPKHPDYETISTILAMDEYAQEDRWGIQFFRQGPWRGKKFAEISEADMVGLPEEAKADLIAAVQKARQKA